MNTEILEEIGLTKSEIKVYLALLELGSTTTGKIVEKSRASSSKIYEILEKLMQKGLASFIIKSGVKYFEAAPPERIMDYMKEKESKLHKQKDGLKEMMPELELKQTLSKYKSEATIFRGMKGLGTAFKDVFKVLKKGDTIYAYVVGEIDDTMNRFFSRHYELRAKKGIKTKTIFSEPGRKRFESRKHIKLWEGKVIPSASTSPATINVYGNKVILRIGDSKNVIAVMIDNKDCAKSFLEQFEALWNQDVTVARGIEGVYNNFNMMLDELNKGEEYYVMGASWIGKKQKVTEFFRDFHKRRQKKGVKSKLLFISGTEQVVNENKDLYHVLSEVKFLPQGIYEGIQINLYKNKVLIFVWREKEPVVFSIDDKNVYQTFKTYFDNLWDQEVNTFKGEDSVEGVYESILESAKSDDDVIIFAAKPVTKRAADYNVVWNREIRKKVKRVRLLYYGDDEVNRARAKEIKEQGCETKILPTKQKLPISTVVIGDTVLNSVWDTTPLTFKIENKVVADSLRANFELLWSQKN